MSGRRGTDEGPTHPLIDTVFKLVHGKRSFRAYETLVTYLGIVSVLLTLAFLTFFFAQGFLPPILIPQIDNLHGFLGLIVGLAFSLATHELSHIVTLANHGIKAKSVGISLTGVIGGYVKAEIPKEEYDKIKFPFFSCGVGTNLLVFLFALSVSSMGVPGLEPFAAVTFWFVVINSIPAPLMDGGKIFEMLLEALRLDRFSDLISAAIIIIWIAAFATRFLTL